MKSNIKGFTLIELLAVIVILAIIALIATPIVLNIINKARQSAAADSVYGVMEAVKLTYTESLLDTDSISLPLSITCDGSKCSNGGTGDDEIIVRVSGTVPSSGTITLNDNGTFNDTPADTPIVINTLKCKIASQKVTCTP